MSSNASGRRLNAGFAEVASLWIHRRVLASLARHAFRRNYAGTSGGIAWAVISPLVPLAIFTAVFSLGLRLPLGNAPYVYGFAAAYVPWVLLSSAISGAAGSIVERRHLVKRVRFPVEIIPAESLLVQSVPHVILLAIVAAACAAAGYVRFPQILSVIYFYACAAVLTASTGLLLAGLTVIARDVQQFVGSTLNVWFWITPVAWSANRLPPVGRTLLALNPAAYIVSGYRYALMPSVFAAPGRSEAAVFWTISILMLLTASACFRRLRTHFWDSL
jgi:ABC-type polysaccharide/polyol phosphate export permease